MKKIIIGLFTICSMAFAEQALLEGKDIFIKNGKAFYITTEQEINGVVINETNGLKSYTTYQKGVKTKQKVLNEKREVVSEVTYDSNGLINGNVLYTDNSSGVTTEGTYKNGIRNGISKSSYYEDLDYEGNFLNGVAHGNAKFLDSNYELLNKTYSNGILATKAEKSIFEEYLTSQMYPLSSITVIEGLAKKDNKLVTGFVFTEKEGSITTGTYYLNGIKKAYFKFVNGFMDYAMIYTQPKNYTEYNFLVDSVLPGQIYTIINYVNDIEQGAYYTYYEDGWRFEGNFENAKLIGKGIYYDEKNKIREVHTYLDNKYTSILYHDYEKGIIEGKLQGEKIGDKWVKTGTAIYYDKDGKLEEEILYSGDTGYSKFYYSNGKIKKEGSINAESGMYLGEVKEYYENGILKGKYNYSDGNLNGKQYYYDELGKEKKVENYDYGTIIE